MLHTKFHGNRPAGSRVGILKGYLHYMVVAAIMVM